MMEFRHVLYWVFEFVTFVPFAVLFWLGVVGPKTDDALYRFRQWCYHDPVYDIGYAPTGTAAVVRRVSLLVGTAGIIAVMVAIDFGTATGSPTPPQPTPSATATTAASSP